MKSFIALITCLLSITVLSNAQDYGRIMEQKVRSLLGRNSTRGYQFASYPVDNFGLATCYDSREKTQICATWTCLAEDKDVPPDTDADSQLKLITLKKERYADVGTGGPVTLTSEEQRNLGLTAVLPQLLKVIGINADLSSAQNVHVELALGPITRRQLIKDRMMQRIDALASTASAKEAYQNRRLAVVYSDIVASSMSVSITFDRDRNAQLDAKLSEGLGGRVGSVIGGKDTELKVKVESAATGKYVLQIARPVILATWTKRQPEAGKLGATDWSRWPDAEVSNAIFKRID
jgi:hypothetical protein